MNLEAAREKGMLGGKRVIRDEIELGFGITESIPLSEGEFQALLGSVSFFGENTKESLNIWSFS